MVDTAEEPEYVSLGAATNIQIYASATSDYPFLRFGTNAVEFAQTFIFQVILFF